MPVPDSDDDVRSLMEVISSLLEFIPKLLSFKCKWSSIRAKLADLKTQLADFSDFAGFSSNQLVLDLLLSVRKTLDDAVSVSTRCEGPDLAEGKLKTQSEVDSVMARLDRHVKDAEVLIKSGVLQDNGIVVSGFSISSKKEAVRLGARNLVIRLQIIRLL